jgi:prevent-host-death family protein
MNRLIDKLVYMAHQTTVGVFAAKARLNSLLKRVSKGDTIRITRRGVPIAKLVPADAGEKEETEQVDYISYRILEIFEIRTVFVRNEPNMYPVFIDLQNEHYEFMGIYHDKCHLLCE